MAARITKAAPRKSGARAAKAKLPPDPQAGVEMQSGAEPKAPQRRFFAVHGLMRDGQGNEGGFFYPMLATSENAALAMGYQSIERDFPGVRVAHIWANDLTEISAHAIAEIDQQRLQGDA